MYVTESEAKEKACCKVMPHREDGKCVTAAYRSHPVEGRTWCHYELGTGDFEVEVGDRWAYLPAPSNEG